jgi:23S rRNA (adenine2503-C2)-methyltransferase
LELDLAHATENKPSLYGLTREELSRLLGSPARARAALRWLYQGETPVEIPSAIPEVSHRAWEGIRGEYTLALPTVQDRSASADGTIKYALEVDRGSIEAVLIPARGRSTVCVSSQVGCTRRCAFCATARLGFRRNLTAAEIVGQYLVARAEAPVEAPLRNVVFMGMGEPMDNLDEVLRAVEVLMQTPAPQLAAGHITVSTSGVLPGIRRFLTECRANLALSLNGTTDEQRERLMPQNKVWPIGELLEQLRSDAARRPGRLTFVEYVLFDGVNDSERDAERLVELLHGVQVRVNLIPHNAFEGSGFAPPPHERMLRFQSIVHRAGIRCLLRASRGREIDAACGQLALRRAASDQD